MDGARLNSRSTINQDHRLVGVDTRLTLLPLARCVNGYLAHQSMGKSVAASRSFANFPPRFPRDFPPTSADPAGNKIKRCASCEPRAGSVITSLRTTPPFAGLREQRNRLRRSSFPIAAGTESPRFPANSCIYHRHGIVLRVCRSRGPIARCEAVRVDLAIPFVIHSCRDRVHRRGAGTALSIGISATLLITCNLKRGSSAAR